MKNFFALIILGSTSLLSADQPQWENPNHLLRDRPTPQAMEQRNPYQPQPYFQNQPRTNVGNQQVILDQEISRNIHDILTSGQFSRGFQNISFEVQNGNVLLKGYANTPENRNRIEAAISGVNGVHQVDNRIFLDRGYPSSPTPNNPNTPAKAMGTTGVTAAKGPVTDQALNSAVQEQLNSAWLSDSAKDVKASVSFGVVTLEGTVNSPEDKEKVEESLKKIQGVRLVKNRIQVAQKEKVAEKAKEKTSSEPNPVPAPKKEEVAVASPKDQKPAEVSKEPSEDGAKSVEPGVHDDSLEKQTGSEPSK